jgi:Leucine-rich repeat (LRR) protein
MKQLLLICAVVMGQSVLAADKKPLTKEESAKVIEAAIRKAAKKPTGELTKADLEKVTVLELYENQLTDVKGLEKLTQLERLSLDDNPDLTKSQIAELQKALPKCDISSNPTK